MLLVQLRDSNLNKQHYRDEKVLNYWRSDRAMSQQKGKGSPGRDGLVKVIFFFNKIIRLLHWLKIYSERDVNPPSSGDKLHMKKKQYINVGQIFMDYFLLQFTRLAGIPWLFPFIGEGIDLHIRDFKTRLIGYNDPSNFWDPWKPPTFSWTIYIIYCLLEWYVFNMLKSISRSHFNAHDTMMVGCKNP